MKKFFPLIVFILSSIYSIAGPKLTSSDPYWIGDDQLFSTTESNDFWLTFMNNASFDPSLSENANVKFDLSVIVTARQQTQIVIEVGGNPVTTLDVAANEMKEYNMSALSNSIYLLEVDETLSQVRQGVHVYSTDPSKAFSCFSYSRVGEKGGSSRDASLIIPTKFLGKEYFIQTYPNDEKSSEFAVVATEDNTEVVITPACQTFGGKPANVPFTMQLQKGDAFLIASFQHLDDNILVDLSGTKICATKPIAVFNGNMKTKIDFAEKNSEDHLVEQALPVTQWGTDFYVSLLDSTKSNRFRVTAGYNNTTVTIQRKHKSGSITQNSYPLNAGQSIDLIKVTENYPEAEIHADKPVMVYGYMTSAADNQFEDDWENNFSFGDPANALLPSLEHMASSINFYVKGLDPLQVVTNNQLTPQLFYIYLVIPTADKNKIKVDGAAVSGSLFVPFAMNTTYSHGAVPVHTEGYHLVESSGAGFVGYVYGMSEAQGWFYTLGYTPDPYRDSLFVENREPIMSKASYDLPIITQGWYQRQLDEWLPGHERLDTAVVCEGTTVKWLAQTALQKNTTQVDWKLYESVEGVLSPVPIAEHTETTTTPIENHRWEYLFDLPDEPELEPWEREPFREYELQVILHKDHVICTDLPNDMDTLRTAVRVTRIYNDTIRRIICMGDTMAFFYDSLPNQGNLNIKGNHADSTLFIGDKTAGESTTNWQWKSRPGENRYKREYETIFGCDSSYTLFLFVCDTFRIIDTLHLCDNERVKYQDTWYKGVKNQESGITVFKDSVILHKYKTTYCACQLDPKYPPFQGCDSIYELHLFIHPSSRDTVVDTLCTNGDPAITYHWPIQYGTAEKIIAQNHPAMQYDYELQAWVGFFEDTLRTTTCPECNKGKGCDSINVLKLIIPQWYHIPEVVDLCRWSYNYETMQRDSNIYRWEHHRDGQAYIDLPESGEYYDSCTTRRFGCDSIYHLTLRYHDPFLKVEAHTIPNNTAYGWHGQVYGPFPQYSDTVLHFYDTKAQKTADGCDSIIRLDLTIKEIFIYTETRSICDNDSLHWRGKTIIGSKYNDPSITPDVRLLRLYSSVYDSLKTVTMPERDSIFRLNIYMYPTYAIQDTKHICDNQVLVWEGKRYAGSQYTGLADYRLSPSNDWYRDTMKLSSIHDCDSIRYLQLQVHPIFDSTVVDSTCQNTVYSWTGHSSVNISTAEPGWHTFTDRLKTKGCPDCENDGCDSIWTLRLYVNPVLHGEVTYHICPEQTPFPYGDPSHHKTTNIEGTYYDTVPSIQYGCDSITAYHIEISDENIVPIVARRCDNDLPYTYAYTNDPTNAIHTFRLENLLHTGEYRDTVSIAGQCRTIYVLYLTEDPTYNITLTQTNVCVNALPYQWEREDGKGLIQSITLPDGANLPYEHTYTTTLTTVQGCDSVVNLPLRINPTFTSDTIIEICDNEANSFVYMFGAKQYQFHRSDKIDHQHIFHIDTTLTTPSSSACDSAMHLHLIVYPSYQIDSVRTICEGDSTWWQGAWRKGKSQPRAEGASFPELGSTEYVSDSYSVQYDALHNCDSVHTLTLNVIPRRYTHIDHTMCDYENYRFGTHIHTHDHGVYYDTLQLLTSTFPQCDSIVTLTLTVNESFHNDTTITICDSEADGFRFTFGTDQYVFDQHSQLDHRHVLRIDTGLLTPSSAACDSAMRLHLIVAPTYAYYDTLRLCESDSLHWQGMLFTGREYTNYGRTYTTAGFDSVQLALPANRYDYAIRRGTAIYNCDSIHYLHLIVAPVYRTTIERRSCQTAEGYYYEHLNNGAGGYLPAIHLSDSLSRNDTVPTVSGCDSIITLHYFVDSVYNYAIQYTFCQDTIDKMREWIDEEGKNHGRVLDVSQAGDFSISQPFQTVHGCDSVYGVQWHVNPIYRFDSTYVICQDERIDWQGKGYSGDNYGWGYERLPGDRYDTHRDSIYHHFRPGDSILAPGSYYDTVRYKTQTDCDSTYYLKLIIKPAGHFIRNEVACEDEGYHVFYSDDANGQYTDTIFFSPITRMINASSKDTLCYETVRRLTAVHGGCDSTMHFHLTVHPSYEFVTRRKICNGESYVWRGEEYHTTGVYYDSIPGDTIEGVPVLGTRHWHCDSVYVLELYVKPVSIIPIYDTICDNETKEHQDTLWYTNGSHSFVETMVWRPGMTIPQSYTDVVFKSPDGCDSIIYRYWLTINKTFLFRDTAMICSGSPLQTETHLYTGYEREYDVDQYIAPFDTVIRDGYSTVQGCDSTYELLATIYPAYRHRDTITICDDGEAYWRGNRYQGGMYGDVPGDGYLAGEHVLYDSLQTKNGCDSIYELHLMVQPTFLFIDNITICADDDFTWHGRDLSNESLGDHFYYDSLLTVYGCDSVYHLNLTVNDTTREVRYDTICRTEIYDFHGVPITEPGYYHDTTFNAWGCHHFTHLYLEVIEPTVPTAWADSICADDNAYDLYVTYTGRDPIGFSLYYDEEGHAYGFEDIIDSAIYDLSEIYPLTLPMPGVHEDRTKYPKPNFYNIKLVLDNGICTNPDLCATDTNIVLSYPSWLTRQRFGDVIALYNEKYNGGYYWSHYQWYHGEEPLIGETHEYLYVPTGLIVGDQYHVRLTREGETQDFQTCPITIVADPIANDFAPTMGYLSVVPTCIVKDYPHAYILSRKDGYYRIISPMGRLVDEGVFRADVTEVVLPSVDGLYIFHLWSPDTPEEPERTIKVIIREQCETCNTPPF